MTIPWWHPVLGDAEVALLCEVAASGYPNDGEWTEQFAQRVADLAGCTYGIGVSSGSAAIYCALAACGVGAGDEVIVPDLTFVATANAVKLTGATPVLVDIRPNDFCIDPERVAAATSPRTKAIVPVHVNGRGGSVAEMAEWADAQGIAMVEDAAEALGSACDGRSLGSFGRAGCFSFAASKIVTTGQGGVVVTDDKDLAWRVRQLKDQGRGTRGTGGADEHPVFGFNFKLTNLQAAVGIAQLESLDERLLHLRMVHEWYAEDLAAQDSPVTLVQVDRNRGAAQAWVDILAPDREALVQWLAERDIDSRPFWYPLHALPGYAAPDDKFPVSTAVSRQGLWLPSALTVTRVDVRAVADAIHDFFLRARSRQPLPE